MGYFRLSALTAMVWCLGLEMAGAKCRICDEIVVFDPPLASCFVSRFDAYEKDVASAPNGMLEIDLGHCSELHRERERGGLLAMPSLTAPGRRLKSVFMLDAAYVKCLGELLTNLETPIDPTIEFDLYAQCPP